MTNLPLPSTRFGDRAQTTFFIATAALFGLTYWLVSDPAEPLSLRIMYRYGNYEYFPLIKALAGLRFGETAVAERIGEGVISFPFGSLVPHALLVRLLGPRGYLAADALIFVAFFLAFAATLRAAGVRPLPANLTALAVGARGGGPLWPNSWTWLWSWRVPRPFVTEVYVFACLALGFSLLRADEDRRSWRWLALGVALSLLLQGDVYFAAIVGLGVAALAIARLFAPPATPPGRLARRLLVLAAGATVAAAPFVLQRAAELPDIPRRLGVFPVARSSPLFLTGVGGPPRSVFIVAALVAAFGLALWLARPDPSLPAKRLPAALIALMLGGYFALPASTVVLGQAVQIYHFVEAFEIVTTFAAVLCALWLLQWGWALASRRRGETLWPRRRWVIGLLVGVVIAGLWLQLATFHRARRFYAGHGRADMAPYNELISYRADARSLAQELARPRYAGALTAATFDQQFSTWWTVFADRLVFFPNPFASPLPDSFFEERVMAFCRLLGMTPEEFFGFLQKRRTLEWLAHYKYQASAAYTFAPLERYSAPETIVAGGKFAGWDLAIPIDELQRLTEAYADLPPDFGRDWRLDLVVLTNDRMFRGRAPDPARFALSYQNPTFRVYLRRAEATAPAQL